MHFPLLQDLVVILGFSVWVVFILQKIKLPSIIGFLITGMLIGPYGLSLIREIAEVELIAEIGVILLLFVIGMEMSVKQLISIKKTVFIGGGVQVGLTVAIVALLHRWMGNDWNQAVFIGFIFSLSSTAIVLKVLQERDEISTSHGRNALGILIFQDIIVVPMILFTPILAGQTGDLSQSLLSLLLKILVIGLVTIVLARYLVPPLLHAVALTRNKELFLTTTFAICLAVAFLTAEAGLSLALGAFLAGLIISESAYSHQATSIILPFRELFTSFFFVSIGMLMNMPFFLSHLWEIVGLVLLVFILKTLIGALATAILGQPSHSFLRTGLALFQVGEFAFILSKVGIKYGLLTENTNQYFLAVSVLTMFLTPFVIILSDRITLRIQQIIPFKSSNKRIQDAPIPTTVSPDIPSIENHLIIIGYGINGKNVAKACQYSKIPYIVLELNPQTVQDEKKKGTPIHYGDASQPHILYTAHLTKSRAVVIAISDPNATRSIIREIRNISQSVYLLVRTRFVTEIPELIALGADDVIPEEFETSVEIFSRVLHNFLIPEGDIQHFVQKIRAGNYEVLAGKQNLPRTFQPTVFPDFKITCLRVNTEDTAVTDTPLHELELRKKFGINILGITRREQLLEQVLPHEKFNVMTSFSLVVTPLILNLLGYLSIRTGGNSRFDRAISPPNTKESATHL
ncbi:MAG: cation:proton antiporter [Saprospiraceae bacterium]